MSSTNVHIIPSIYLSNYLDDFESLMTEYSVEEVTFKEGAYLTNYGEINNHSYFIRNGIIHLSLGHDAGVKSMNLFGPKTIFPIGVEKHEFHIEYEMIIQAFTDVSAYKMEYTTLRNMIAEHGGFAAELFRQNCDFVGYVFFDTINQTFEPCMARICDTLLLFLLKMNHHNCNIEISQQLLASIAGASQSQMERSLQVLRKAMAIETSRKNIRIINRDILVTFCSDGMKTNLL